MAETKEISVSGIGLIDGETPSRYELLSMVKKHSNLLGWTVVDEQDASDVGMDAQFWHEVLDMYFVRGRVAKGREEDDLIFFVRNMSLHGYGFNDNMDDASPFFVRRWAPTLEKVIGANSADIDWGPSFYLNLIAHTSYTVTVAICSIQALRRHQNGESTTLSPIYKVIKTVYASPSRVNFLLDHKKAAETLPAYPNICFAVDDFDDTFDAVLTLFSGFVSYQMVREAYDGRSRFGSLLSLGSAQSKTDRLYMRGPGGRGEVEVAVSGIADQSRSSLTSPLSKRHLGIDLGSIVQKAASAASELAKHAYAAASTNRKSDELLPLKCCLMSISLPWEHIAHDLLFKASPPLNL
ncbi:uncharacterized protein [Typha latifolia]|uniref:uncharacterized protein isoform X4 n=1 Tax=Typha latifolia TaxID=4733 RepID=UPI003C2E04CA